MFCNILEHELLQAYQEKRKSYSNTTKEEQETIKQLSSSPSLKPADKGGAIVILNTRD